MREKKFNKWLLCAVALTSGVMCAQSRSATSPASVLQLRIGSSQPGKHRAVAAVVWLEPLTGTPALPFLPHGRYTLLQKNRTFTPHLQVIPAGSVVQFPNADPFFHNVFSLFNGKRFDLGLYEAGSSKSVTFPREGVSYIFCNIHPEMSAVVISLTTPLYAIADANDAFVLTNIPPGDYILHFWIEGVPQSTLGGLDRRVHLTPGLVDLGELSTPMGRNSTPTHSNKFGRAYDTDSKSIY
ncbi:MAG: hypothetical protein WBG23_14655 [Acidobacteriaceae bacterium]